MIATEQRLTNFIEIYFTAQIAAVVPKSALPGVSIIVDTNKFAAAAPKKSFLKWKQQHEALFEPKRFLTTNQATAFDKRKMVPLQDTPTVNPKFELDFYKAAPVQQVKQEDCQQFENDCNKYRKNFPGNVKPEFQSMMAFSQQNRVARSEATRFDVPLEGQRNNFDYGQANACGCRCVAVIPSSQDENPWPIQNDDLEKNEGQQLDLQLVDSSKKTVSKSVSKEVLVNIVEEQIEIVQQQKHILMQQNEIFNLQYQIEKSLLMNNDLKNTSPAKQLQCSPIRKCITSSPNVQPPIEANGTMQSIVNSPNSSPQSRKSIGVMTSFHGNVNEVWSPNANQNLASEKESHKDTMLERINKIIQNSPPMINYRVNNANCRVSPKQADINISSQT